MQVKAFLTLVESGHRANYFVVAPDQLGLHLLLPRSLEKVAAKEDIHFYDAAGVTKDKARQLEKESRKAPVGSSEFTYFVITGLQNLPTDSVGPLLKAVEEAKYAVFVFQAQSIPRAVRTILSRSILVNLPFLSKKVVLGNMQALHYDARTADELGLYDGTLAGTIRAVSMKDTLLSIRRDMRLGARGLASTQSDEVIGSLALDAAIAPLLSQREVSYLKRDSNEDRKRMVVFLAAERESSK